MLSVKKSTVWAEWMADWLHLKSMTGNPQRFVRWSGPVLSPSVTGWMEECPSRGKKKESSLLFSSHCFPTQWGCILPGWQPRHFSHFPLLSDITRRSQVKELTLELSLYCSSPLLLSPSSAVPGSGLSLLVRTCHRGGQRTPYGQRLFISSFLLFFPSPSDYVFFWILEGED